MNNCERTDALIDSWLDDALSEDKLARLMSHCDSCSICRDSWDAARRLRHDLASLNRAAERLITAAPTTVKPAPPAPDRPPAARTWALRIAAAVAVAATISIGLRWGRMDSPSPQRDSIALETRRNPPIVLEVADAERIVLKHPSHGMAVEFATGNPDVQVVWLYSATADEGSPATTRSSGT